MNKISLLFLMFCLSSAIQAQTTWSKEELEVQATITQFFEALSQRDSVKLKQLSAPDLVLFEYGSTWTIDTLILKAITLNTAPDFSRKNSFDFIRTTIRGTTAWASYHLHSDIFKNGNHSTVEWQETIIAIKERKKWKIKVLHSSLLKRT
jgi:ketosteroid isomerase-like protein